MAVANKEARAITGRAGRKRGVVVQKEREFLFMAVGEGEFFG
jgi:hypothetical protein